MPSSYLWFKDRKTATRLTMFLIVIIILSLVLALFINKKKVEVKHGIENNINDGGEVSLLFERTKIF